MIVKTNSVSRRELCVLVANESDAILYLQENRRAALIEYARCHNDAARHRLHDQTSDRPGRSFDSHGQGRHHLSPRSDARDNAVQRFAADLVAILTDGVRRGDIGDYALIVAPRFLGVLRKELAKTSLKKARFTVDKDVVHQPVADTWRLLPGSPLK